MHEKLRAFSFARLPPDAADPVKIRQRFVSPMKVSGFTAATVIGRHLIIKSVW